MRLPDDTGQRSWVSSGVTVIIYPITDSEMIETCAQIQKDPFVAAGPRPTSEHSPQYSPRIAVEQNPAIFVQIFIKKIEDHGQPIKNIAGIYS
jgi:hypothetical protein